MSYENMSYYYDSLMDDSFYDDYFQFINDHCKYSKVLELGSGTGEIALRMARNGIDITATDLSGDMLEVCTMKAESEELSFPVYRMDMTDFEASEDFDLVLCLCDSINYVLDEDLVYKTFKNSFQSLKSHGTFIFDSNSEYKIHVTLKDYEEEQEDEDFYFHWTVKNTEPYMIEHDVVIKDYENHDTVKEHHIQKIMTIDAYLDLLNKAGFHSVEYYSDFKDYYKDCQRIIFVCRKD